MTIRLYDQHSTSFDFNPGASLPFADIAELAAFDDRQISDGGLAYTTSVRSLWIKRVVSPVPTTDGITIVATASGDGAWYRSTAPSLSWQSQAAWYIDPAAGDDENDGETTATALATFAEFNRRVETIGIQMTLTILSNTTEALTGHFSSANTSAYLIIQGQPTVLASGGGPANSTIVNPVPTTNSRGLAQVPNLLTAAGAAADLSSYVGKILRCPSIDSAGDFVTPALRASGVDVNVSWWARTSGSNTKPVDGTTVEVLDLITCPTVRITTDTLPVLVKYLSFTSTSTLAAPVISINAPLDLLAVTPPVTITGSWFGCIFGGYIASGAGMISRVTGCLASGAGTVYPQGGVVLFLGGGSTTGLSHFTTGCLRFQAYVIEGAKLSVGQTTLGPACVVESPSSTLPLGVFGSPGNGVEMLGGSTLRAATLFGASNTSFGLTVSAASSAFFTGTPTITGTSGDLQLNAAATAIPPLTASAVTPADSALTTWAQWVAAPFSRNVMSYANGSKISGA